MSGWDPEVGLVAAVQEATLIEAYHVLFDIKDATDGAVRYAAYQACSAVASLMQSMGIAVPERYDGDGRPS